MVRQCHSAEEIVNKLRRAEVGLMNGSSVASVCNLLSVTERAYDRCWKRHRGLKTDQAHS